MKPVNAIGLLFKKEASYNAGGTLATATDGVLLDEHAKITFGRGNDGARPAPPSMLGYQRRVAPSGRTGSVSPKVSAKGAGVAYSASVFPNIHNLLQCAGFDAAVDVTGGAEKWTYTPTPITSTPSSGVASWYGRGQLYPHQGIYCDLNIGADGAVVPTWEFPLQGLMPTAFTDVSVPAITYPALGIDPPKSVGISFTLGNMTAAIVRKWSFKLQRGIQPATDQNVAGGHSGFRPQRRTPVLEVTYETPALVGSPFTGASTIDPYQLFDNASAIACSLQIGSVQYNKWKLTAGNVQLMADPVEDEDGATALTTVSLQLNPTTLNANDDVTFLFN